MMETVLSRALNLIWINLDFPPDAAGSSTPFRNPLPPEYLDRVKNAAANNPDTTVRLWVDSKRLTKPQTDFLREQLAVGSANIELQDLRSISAYDNEKLYNKPETSRFWRDDKKSLIWRQVDAAKVLVCLQGNFDQVFFADMDLADFSTSDPKLQKMLATHGMFVNHNRDYPLIENQMWGFDRKRRAGFFDTLYKNTLREAYKGENGWMSLVNLVDQKLCTGPRSEKIYLYDIVHFTTETGPRAHHPDHRYSTGMGDVNRHLDPAPPRLATQFAKFGAKIPAAVKTGLSRARKLLL